MPGKADKPLAEIGKPAYETPVFDAGDPLVCHAIQLRASLWQMVYNELQKLGETWSWRQPDATHATPAQVIAEIRKATDNSVFAGCSMIGDVTVIARDPAAWELICDGATYLRVDYPDLYAVLDPAFIVDADHFTVPDLADRFIFIGTGIGDSGGESSHVLTIAEIPAHTHGEQDPGSVVVQAGTPSVALADPGLPSQTGSTGGGEAHNNMPPYFTLQAVILARLPYA